MERPQTVLISLLAIGIASSGFFYSAHQTSTLSKKHKKALTEQKEVLEAKIEKLSADSETGPTTNDLLPKTDANTSEERLQEQVAFLEEQLDLLRDENARLLAIVDRLETKLNSAGGTGEGRAFSGDEEMGVIKVKELTSKSRELGYKAEVDIEFTDWEGMAKAVADSLQPKRDTDQQAKLSRAYAAMGFVAPATDVTQEITDLLTSQLGAALYTGDNKILFNQDGNMLSVHDRTSLAVALDHALQDQNFDLSKAPIPTQTNDDSYTAATALLLGDTSIIKLRHMMYDTAVPSDDLRNSPTALSKEDFNAATPFIREYFLFPYTAGQQFCEALHEKGKWKSINAAIQSPPTSSAEILNPELYLADAPFEPESYSWPSDRHKLSVNGVEPLWNNVAGELAISVYLNRGYYKYTMSQQGFFDTDLPPLSKRDYRHNPGSVAANGWRGDRYLVFPNGDGSGASDHVYWRSKWASPEDAAEFFHGARVALAHAHDITIDRADYEIESEPEDREPITPETTGITFAKETRKGRQIRIDLKADTREVIIINAADKAWLDALVKLP